MNWIEAHRKSEELAAQAHQALRQREYEYARNLFRESGDYEQLALRALSSDRPRTLGITAVSATALFYKGGELDKAEQLAHELMGWPILPGFARDQLRGLLQTIWNERAQEQAGVSFEPGQVLVSVKGGQVVTGGAPLDLIVSKVQVIQSLFYRTAELIKDIPLRISGPPSKEIQEKYQPWLFQSVPGSYQFIVVVQKPRQKDLFPSKDPTPELLTKKFLEILRASADESPSALAEVVPREEYRETFLKLTRNLAPTGKTFETLEIRGADDSRGISLSSHSRKQIAAQLKPPTPTGALRTVEESLKGVLRALDLERDWLEVTNDLGQHVRVNGVGEVIDDLIGPMVNHPVTVQVRREIKSGRYSFIDIESDD